MNIHLHAHNALSATRMTMPMNIIPQTLGFINTHLPPVISDLVGQYFISIKTMRELAQESVAHRHVEGPAANMLLEARWVDPGFPSANFAHPNMLIVNNVRVHALRVAVQHGYGEILDALMRGLGVDIPDYVLDGYYKNDNYGLYREVVGHAYFRSWNSLLVVASEYNLANSVMDALCNGADCLDDALYAACKRNNNEISTLLIRHGANSCMWHNESRDKQWGGCFSRVLGWRSSSWDDSEEECDDDADKGDDDGDDGGVGVHVIPK